MIRVQLTFDAAEALRVILTHEKIPFTVGVGKGPVLDIETSDSQLDNILNQWEHAILKIKRHLP